MFTTWPEVSDISEKVHIKTQLEIYNDTAVFSEENHIQSDTSTHKITLQEAYNY